MTLFLAIVLLHLPHLVLGISDVDFDFLIQLAQFHFSTKLLMFSKDLWFTLQHFNEKIVYMLYNLSFLS